MKNNLSPQEAFGAVSIRTAPKTTEAVRLPRRGGCGLVKNRPEAACPTSSQSPLSFVSGFAENYARSLAPPFQTAPAALGCGLVRKHPEAACPSSSQAAYRSPPATPKAHSLRCSSSPKPTRFAELGFGLDKTAPKQLVLLWGGFYVISDFSKPIRPEGARHPGEAREVLPSPPLRRSGTAHRRPDSRL